MILKRWIGLAVLLAALVIGERTYLYRPDHKYRLTVEIETPDGVRSASGVFSVHPNRAYGGSGSGPAGPRIKGDAVFVDLGNGRNLAMLLLHGTNPAETDGMSYLPLRAFAAAGRRMDFRDVKRQTDAVAVTGELIPTLVSFADAANPASIRVVDPANLQAAFGRGFRLRQISLQIVPSGFWPLDFGGLLGEPVTRAIQMPLQWSKDPAKAATALTTAGIVAVPPPDAEFQSGAGVPARVAGGPHQGCCYTPSFRGARLRANPESIATNRISAVMDSGSAPSGASRNDG